MTITLTRLPLDEVSRDVTEYWLPLETPDGTPLLEVRVVVSSGAHLLHLIHTATRLRQADAFGAGGEWVASLARIVCDVISMSVAEPELTCCSQ